MTVFRPRTSIPCTRPRRLFKSPIRSPANSSGATDFHIHHGLEQNRLGFPDAFLERERAGNLECHFRRIDVVVRAVIKDHAEIDGRKSRKHSLLPRFLNSFFDGGNEVSRNRAAENFVHEFEIAAARQRLHPDLAIAILAVTAALFLVFALNVGFALDRFAIRNFRRMQQHFHAVSLLEVVRPPSRRASAPGRTAGIPSSAARACNPVRDPRPSICGSPD